MQWDSLEQKDPLPFANKKRLSSLLSGAVGRYTLALSMITLLLIFLLFWYNVTSSRQTYYALAESTAASFFDSIVVTRRWNSLQNGVYVPVSDWLQPNPYLLDSLRDITDNTGRNLTKVNPALMTRLIGELLAEELGITYRVTSLNPLNPANVPDPWETESLLGFEREGNTSTSELVTKEGGEPYLRYMAPLVTEGSCLSCHAHQGYQEGDTRGGISVRIPYAPFEDAFSKDTQRTIWVFSGVLIVILASACFFGKRVSWAEWALHKANAALEKGLKARERQNAEMNRLYSALDTEMQNARKAHQHLIQQTLPNPKGLSLAEYHKPATLIGGDFSYAMQKGDCLILYVSDITGHGLEGTIFSLFVKACIDSYVALVPESQIKPDAILTYLDQQVRKGGYPSEYAVTTFLAVINTATMEALYSAAGFQNAPVLVHEDGYTELLESHGLPISPDIPVEIMEFACHSARILGNTTLFLATDGIYEQRNSESMYEQRLLSILKRCHCLPPATIADLVDADFRSFLGEEKQEDDVTFIVVSTTEREVYLLPSSFDALDTIRGHVHSYYKDCLEREDILLAVHELVANAIEHGNRHDLSKYVKVLLSQKAIVVEDKGDGFDWQSRMKTKLGLDLDKERGRGIAMTQMLVGQLVYNEKGNRVSLIID